MIFSVDNSWVGTIPAGNGFHERGGFDAPNIWENATIMAPFDQEVGQTLVWSYLLLYIWKHFSVLFLN